VNRFAPDYLDHIADRLYSSVLADILDDAGHRVSEEDPVDILGRDSRIGKRFVDRRIPERRAPGPAR